MNKNKFFLFDSDSLKNFHKRIFFSILVFTFFFLSAFYRISHISISSYFDDSSKIITKKNKDAVRWKKLAKSTDTIVIMMGLSRIGIICKQLSDGGIDKKTPVAVIQDGTTSKQRMITGTVSNITQKVKTSKIKPPSIIIIGKVVSLSKTIGWRKK